MTSAIRLSSLFTNPAVKAAFEREVIGFAEKLTGCGSNQQIARELTERVDAADVQGTMAILGIVIPAMPAR